MKLSKVKYIDMSAQIVAELCKRAIKNKFPNDAEAVRVQYDTLTNNFKIVVYSEEFPEVLEGAMIPKLDEPVISEDIFK
jgi:predicted nucleic acid-binding protein